MHAPRHARLALSLCAGGLLGCNGHREIPTPRYPELKTESRPRASFTPAATLTRLSLPCMQSELALDNGLDDDCDGAVDGRPKASDLTLFVTLSHPSLVDVTLALTPGKAEPDGAKLERAHVCETGAAFSVQTLSLPSLAKGHYELTLTRAATCGAELPASVDASVWLHGKLSGVYAVSVAPGAPTLLGAVDLQ